MSQQTTARRAALAGFLLGASATSIAAFVVYKIQRRKRGANKTSKSTKTLPPELRREQLSRHELYFGTEGMDTLANASVVVVGLGGVGSHTAHMLARGGVGFLRIIDFDQVTLSSLNRHACATLQDVGTPKATCLKMFLEKICSSYCQIDAMVEMYTAFNGKRLLEGHSWDLVIDAIDDVPTKAALLAQCIATSTRVISCMGAGGKSDPTRMHVSDLRTASRDPLASKLRYMLKKLLPSSEKVMDQVDKLAVVYSSEKVVAKLADFTEEQKSKGVHHYGAVDNMRIRVLPVLGTMPAVMGQTLAAVALCELGGKPFQPVPGERIGRQVRHRLFQHLKQREKTFRIKVEKEAGMEPSKLVPKGEIDYGCKISETWVGPPQVDDADMEYLLEIWMNRCAVNGDRLGAVLSLVRWDVSKPCTCNNLVLMGAKALQKFDASGMDSIPPDVRLAIEARLDSCKIDAYTIK